MSKPVLSDAFAFSACRRNRQSYALATVLQGSAIVALVMVYRDLATRDSTFAWLIALPFLGIILVWMMAAATQRLRDFGWSGYWLLLLLLPGLGFFLLPVLFLKKGTKGRNKYGPSPLRPRKLSRRRSALVEAALAGHDNPQPAK